MEQTIILDGYLEDLYILEELEMLNEVELKKAIEKFLPREKMKSVIRKLQQILNPGNPKETLKKMKALGIPRIETKKIISYLDGKSDVFAKNRKKAEVVLKNSLPEAQRKIIPLAATVVAIKSVTRSKREPDKNPDKALKDSLREFVGEVREVEEDHKEKINKDALLDYAIGAVTVTIALGVMFLFIKGTLEVVIFIKGVIMVILLIILIFNLFLLLVAWIAGGILTSA
jgi:hypothetical protein